MLELAAASDRELAERLIENALEDCVSAFDGFGREMCKLFCSRGAKPDEAAEIRFQNVVAARKRVQNQFGIDFAAHLDTESWNALVRCFEKRHLVAHKMGIIDESYRKNANDARAIIGRKVQIQSDEVRALIPILATTGKTLFELLESKL
jgi:hypothetical protein